MGNSNEILTLVSDQHSPDTGSSIPENWIIRIINLSKRFEIYLHDRNRVYEFFGNRSHHHDRDTDPHIHVRGSRKRNRHHGADHGDAHPARGIHPG